MVKNRKSAEGQPAGLERGLAPTDATVLALLFALLDSSALRAAQRISDVFTARSRK